MDASPGSSAGRHGRTPPHGGLKKTLEKPGERTFLDVDEAGFHLTPELAYRWSLRGRQVVVPSAGQNRRVPVFGARNALSGEVIAMVTERKRHDDFFDFLDYLFGHDTHCERVTLFMDTCSIHHAGRVRDYVRVCHDHVHAT